MAGTLNKPNLIYPIVNDGDYYGRISFEAMIQPPADINFIESFTPAGTGGRGSETKKKTTTAWEGVTDVLSYTATLANSAIDAYNKADTSAFNGANYEPITPRTSGITPDGKVTLYLPTQVQIQDGVTYDNMVNLGTVGGLAENGIGGGSSVINSAAAGAATAVENFTKFFETGIATDAARVGAVRFAETIPMFGYGDEVSAAVKTQLRVTANPNTRTLFKSVPIRNFVFSFKLIANSSREAAEIANIIKFFRTQLYPAGLEGSGSASLFGLKFPNKFHIRMSYKNQEIGVKFLPSYITNFNATYNSHGGGFHADGQWTDVEITISFTEERALTRYMVEKKGY